MTPKKIEEKRKRNAAKRRAISKSTHSNKFYFTGRRMIT